MGGVGRPGSLPGTCPRMSRPPQRTPSHLHSQECPGTGQCWETRVQDPAADTAQPRAASLSKRRRSHQRQQQDRRIILTFTLCPMSSKGFPCTGRTSLTPISLHCRCHCPTVQTRKLSVQYPQGGKAAFKVKREGWCPTSAHVRLLWVLRKRRLGCGVDAVNHPKGAAQLLRERL